MPFSQIDYQLEHGEHSFNISTHGNSTKTKRTYLRTQKSTLIDLRDEVKMNEPRIAVDSIAEKQGGIFGSTSSATIPRNITQAYNMSKSKLNKLLIHTYQ